MTSFAFVLGVVPLIIATGASAMYLGLESEEQYKGKGVSGLRHVRRLLYRGKPVAVVGGGNAAVEEALYLSNIASHVTLVHRRDTFPRRTHHGRPPDGGHQGKAASRSSSTARSRKCSATARASRVLSSPPRRRSDKTVDVEGVFIAIGHRPNTSLFEGKLELDRGYIVTAGTRSPAATATSVPGVFAAGDVQDQTYRQAVTSAATGCMAALDAQRFLENQQ